MDDSIRDRFILADTDLLFAIEHGEKSLETYHSTWAALQSDFTHALNSGIISDATVALAHTAAARVVAVTTCFMDMTSKQQALTSHFLSDLDRVMEELDHVYISDDHVARRSTNGTPLCPEDSSPTFAALAYDFLLQNIHNPYPTSDTKQSIARAAGCPVSSVSAWFSSARRRMGWTALCREYFHNCRADAVDAAYRALVKEDPSRRLAPETIHAFMVMKVTAEGLYSSTFTKSALAGDLDAVVKDMTEEDRKFAAEAKRREAEETGAMKEREKDVRRKQRALERALQKSVAQDFYPSPDRSYTSSPEPTLEESLADEDVLPPVLAGCKRRRSSKELIDRASLPVAARPMKRLRSSKLMASPPEPEPCLPSPPWSVDSAEDPPDNDPPSFTVHTLTPALSTQNHTNAAAPRKRRLSDADPSSMPKRPRGSMAGPRLHAVSDPLPRFHLESEYCIDEWFNTNFDALFALPPPVGAADPDFSAPWEVELFSDYSILQDLRKRISKSPPPSTQESRTSASTHLTELESLLQSIETCGFVAPSKTVNSTSALADPLSLDVPLSSDLSQSINWTTLLNNTETFEPTIDSILPQQLYTDPQPLPEIDLSMVQLPQVMPTATFQATVSGDLSSKQAKLSQLQVMQEAVRRMQEELQSEGVAL
ncbi:hypothetical protein BS17DRAFT_879469 [Gyrodon lividus]|nr:hypothetical protein BS17DRAFT_879469 [Gyrodon lividus]